MAESDISVLIVEDNPLNAAQMVNIVNEFTGDITVSTTAERGLIIFKQAIKERQPYHVLITDINLPGMNGKDLIQEVRELEENSTHKFRVRIIAISADPPTMHVLEACRVGAGCYLEKPVSKEKLSTALNNTDLFN